jgi:hypothetical protein
MNRDSCLEIIGLDGIRSSLSMFFSFLVSRGSGVKLCYLFPSWDLSFFCFMVKSEAENVMKVEI